MKRFLYYLPSASVPVSDAVLTGTLPHLAGCRLEQGQIMSRGPDGGSGALLAIAADGQALQHEKGSQTWIKTPDFWLGWTTGKMPGPDDLRKMPDDEMVLSYKLSQTAAKGFSIPVARHQDGESPLPKVRTWDEDGNFKKALASEWRGLYADADEAYDYITRHGTISEERITEIAVAAISSQYHAGKAELSVMEVLTDEAIKIIIWARIDAAGWDQQQGDDADVK